MDNIISFQDQEAKGYHQEDEELEALSLCDFPLSSDEPVKKDSSKSQNDCWSSSQTSDFFEFSNDLNSEINLSHAEDIISCGKLVPYKQLKPAVDNQILKSLSGDEDAVNFLPRRYCESLPELNPIISNSSSSTRLLARSSCSLDGKKLSRNSSLVMESEVSDFHRSFSRGLVKPEVLKGSKPSRWYSLMFGLVKFPPEMDLRDIKNRQVRRNPGSMFPAVDTGGGVPAGRSDHRRGSWSHDLLRVLSCKNHASVAVTAPVGACHNLEGFIKHTHVTIT